MRGRQDRLARSRKIADQLEAAAARDHALDVETAERGGVGGGDLIGADRVGDDHVGLVRGQRRHEREVGTRAGDHALVLEREPRWRARRDEHAGAGGHVGGEIVGEARRGRAGRLDAWHR